MIMIGHQSLFFSGPIAPSGRWWVRVQSTQGFDLGDQFRVFEQVREGDEPVEVIGTALPAFAAAAEPGRVRADVGPEFIEVAGNALSLDPKLLAKPAFRLHGAEGQQVEGARRQRGAVADGLRGVQREPGRH